ncbi:Organ specific protein [Spatholobus suberectus]|nr:Organ specific protein [Spatholobus suberectus]
MKSNFAVFVVFSLLLVANFSCARKDLGGYWKNTMKDQPMPQAIKDLVGDPQASDTGKDRFIRDFDVKPKAILYHTHVVSMKQKQKVFVNNQD